MNYNTGNIYCPYICEYKDNYGHCTQNFCYKFDPLMALTFNWATAGVGEDKMKEILEPFKKKYKEIEDYES